MSDDLVTPGYATPIAGQAVGPLSLHWIKGPPVSLENSTGTFVLDFFGTMCSDCVASIPDLSDLAERRKDKDVTVVGVHILERRKTIEDLEAFVAKQGDKLRYSLAKDLDRSAENIWKASGLEAMPGLVVIRDSKVLWSGYEIADLEKLLHLSLLLSISLSSFPSLTHAQDPPLHHDLTILLPDIRTYREFDSYDYDYPEIAASAVTPFCKSFTFLCHLRCLQRGDPRDAGAVLPNTNDARAEISRCNGAPSLSGPGSNSLKVLCLCGNGVDLTAEVSYALEGVVDIQAAGGSGTGEGEAGQIREVAYQTVTQTHIEYRTRVVTQTQTQVVNTCLPVPGGGAQDGKAPPVVNGVREDDGDDGEDGEEEEPFEEMTIRDSDMPYDEYVTYGEDEDVDLYPEYEDNYLGDDADLRDTGADLVDGIEFDLFRQKVAKTREDL
ncbi:hypothetical protein CPC16_000286 [Podila verticillata]|nr:hypothetical protein CPC16_000286 [Podila verticillata]